MATLAAPPPEDLGARVSVSALGRAVTDVERAIADRALPAMSRCRTDRREREALSFVWMGGGLAHAPDAVHPATPLRECIQDAVMAAAQPASTSGIVTFTVTLEPRS